MKAVVSVALAMVLATAARAEWKDLKEGMDAPTALQCIGAPLLVNQGRTVSQLWVWTYDLGGYVQFEHGLVTYWQAPKPKKTVGPDSAIAKQARRAQRVPLNILAKS